MLRSLLASCAFVLTAPSLTSGVLVVDDAPGPGVTHTNLSAAITAAADGDTILVRPGLHGIVFIDGKSLTIVADGSPRPSIFGNLLVRNLTATQHVVLRGFDNIGVTLGLPGLRILDCAGAVFVEDCSFDSTDGQGQGGGTITAAVQVERSARVVFTRCALEAKDSVTQAMSAFGSQDVDGPHGLHAEDSHVALYDCVLRGAVGYAIGCHGGDGAMIAGGSLFASGCSFQGSQGGPAGSVLIFPVTAGDGGNGVRLTDRVLTGVSPYFGFAGSTTLTTPAIGRFVDCTFVGAPGGDGGTTPNGAVGQPIATAFGASASLLGEPARSFESSSPVHAGGSTTLTFKAPAGELVFTAAAIGAQPFYVNALAGTLVPTLPFFFTTIGMMPASGELELTIPLPPLPPGSGALHIVHQAVFGTSTGDGRLGAPSTLLLLDPAY
jgi:hypothetical protein